MGDLPNFSIENSFSGKKIAGIDEAGRGPLVGPVVAAAVILDSNLTPPGINDSKKLSIKKREWLYTQIINNNHYGIGISDVDEIDKYNILQATKLAMQRAYENLSKKPDIVIIDGNMLPNIDIEKYAIIKGDTLSLSIAAASIIAKVTRDNILTELARKYPNYGWEKNAGYGTKAHLAAIAKYGITEFHRKSFAPIREQQLIFTL